MGGTPEQRHRNIQLPITIASILTQIMLPIKIITLNPQKDQKGHRNCHQYVQIYRVIKKIKKITMTRCSMCANLPSSDLR